MFSLVVDTSIDFRVIRVNLEMYMIPENVFYRIRIQNICETAQDCPLRTPTSRFRHCRESSIYRDPEAPVRQEGLYPFTQPVPNT